jgi:hypothetical protein
MGPYYYVTHIVSYQSLLRGFQIFHKAKFNLNGNNFYTKKAISILFLNFRIFCIVDLENINSHFVTGTL